MRQRIWVFLLCLAAAAPVRAGTKEELARLQSDVLALQNQLRVLEKSVNESTEVLKSLISQLNDSVAKSGGSVSKIQSTLDGLAANDRSSNQAVLSEIRNLGGKIDDAGVRISALAQQVSEMKMQAKPVTARRFQNMGGDAGVSAEAADTVFFEAYNDLVQGNFELAIQGFTTYVTTYPKSEKADDAQYYIGEAYYNDKKLPQAITAFTRVVNDFGSGDKAASALFKRAMAEKQVNEKENAITDLRSLIQRFPAAPEAGLAKAELESLGAGAAVPPARARRP